MDKFLDTCNLQRLNHDKVENLNRSITSKGINSIIKTLPTQKTPRPEGFTCEFCHTFKEELISTLIKVFPKNGKGGNTHLTKPALSRQQSQIRTQQEIYRPISLINIDAKVLNKILAQFSDTLSWSNIMELPIRCKDG